MRNKGRIVFYGNSSPEIGAGHIMRMFALAQVASEHFDVTFVYKTCTSDLVSKLRKAGFDTLEVSDRLSYTEFNKLKAAVIVVDDYHLTQTEWLMLANLKTYIVNLDDGLTHDVLYADLVVNPAANANINEYKVRAAEAEFCLGPQYSYIRKEFSDTIFEPVTERTNILVTLGGTDPKSLALPICKALLGSPANYHVQLLIGRTHRDQEVLEVLQDQHERFSIVLNPPSVACHMMQAGLAISAAGGTLGELASQGVPTIALVTVDNQIAALDAESDDGWFKAIDFRKFNQQDGIANHNDLLLKQIEALADELWRDNRSRERMSLNARQLIDAHGCRRIIDKINKRLDVRHKKS